RLQKQLASVPQDVIAMENPIRALLSHAGVEQESRHLDRRDGVMRHLLNAICQRIYRDKPDAVPIDIQDFSHVEIFNCEWKLMETVIANLLQHAQRFARTKIVVELKITPTEYQVFVEDDGPGIAQQDRARVFD